MLLGNAMLCMWIPAVSGRIRLTSHRSRVPAYVPHAACCCVQAGAGGGRSGARVPSGLLRSIRLRRRQGRHSEASFFT